MKRIVGVFFVLLSCLCVACGSAGGEIVESTKEVEVSSGVEEGVEESSAQEEVLIKEEPIELIVYSELSSYNGEQAGWFAQVMLEKFNVKLMISPLLDFDKSLEQGFLGDIMVFGSTGNNYREAVEEGLLLDWEEDGLLAEHGPYILENMKPALEHNRSLTPEMGKVYGFGNSVASDSDAFGELLFSWDIRWDLYEQLGYPQVQDLDGLITLFEDMKELCPTDDNGEETYAMAIWPEWDSDMVLGIRYMVGAYYGFDAFHMGFYDAETGAFHGALEENGPYLEMLKFFNTLYRKGLLALDGDSQTYEEVIEKLESSGLFFSPVEYAGSLSYNTEAHIAENKYMASLVPAEAVPAAYGMSVTGGNRVWAIGASSQHKELCMEIINWFCTPEGVLTGLYGPKGVCWDYDAKGNTYFTELGKSCFEDRVTMMPEEYGGSYFGDGSPQINNSTWVFNAENPESNGETYNAWNWKSNLPEASCGTEQDWREYTGACTALEYMQRTNCVVIPEVPYEEAEKSESLQKVWEQVGNCIVTESWRAISAESDEEYEKIVSGMIAGARACGYEQCVAWCELEAERRYALEEKIRGY